MKEIKPQNNHAFIDSQNLNLGVRSQGWQLDFGKFRQYLITKYHVKKTYLFIGYIHGNQGLYTYLQNVGYICIFKPTLEIKEGKNQVRVKGNVDAELVLHAMIEFNNYNKAIIVSGDGDFHCLAEYLESKNKLLKIIAPNQRYSSLLKKFNQYIVVISPLKQKLRVNKKRGIPAGSKVRLW
ncbi:MAG: NYN domain-containing protein [Candidatus Beckwithbacteria bacterium]|nr:NYN domain-containing protein [Candidatus Beckwithbacteria bacterium]